MAFASHWADFVLGLAILDLFQSHCCPIWVVVDHYFPKTVHFPKSFALVQVLEYLVEDCIGCQIGCQKMESLAMGQLLELVLEQENMAFESLHNMGHIDLP